MTWGRSLSRLRSSLSYLLRATALISALFFSNAANSCDLNLLGGVKPPIITYDSFSLNPGASTLKIRVENLSQAPCDLGIDVTSAIGARPPFVFENTTASVDLRVPGQTPKPSAVGIYRVVVPAESQTELILDASVLNDPVVEAGKYTTNVIVKFYNTETGLIAAPNVETFLALESTPRAQVNIAGVAAHFDKGFAVDLIDFGELESNESRRVFVQVRANVQSNLSFTSSNRGVLKAINGNAEIPYSAKIDGNPLNLSQTTLHTVNPPRTRAGASLPFDIKVGDISKAFAGRYEDTITIEIAPY